MADASGRNLAFAPVFHGAALQAGAHVRPEAYLPVGQVQPATHFQSIVPMFDLRTKGVMPEPTAPASNIRVDLGEYKGGDVMGTPKDILHRELIALGNEEVLALLPYPYQQGSPQDIYVRAGGPQKLATVLDDLATNVDHPKTSWAREELAQILGGMNKLEALEHQMPERIASVLQRIIQRY